jgi:hypothetical protein
MILLAADGLENKKIAVRLGQDPGKVGRWRQRYVQMGLAGILKETAPGNISTTTRRASGEDSAWTVMSRPLPRIE